MVVLEKPILRPDIISERPGRHVEYDEVVAFCPKCTTIETLVFTRDGLAKTRRFIQHDSQVFHDCGSVEPCRLFGMV